ncbi:hypothetical protein NE235_16635 [Actinoallomurus spadix]|nr:hypothetical protein [Actinoallomurus spadix]MCO5987731.1 hypothetical protein [Actinoallomurus spadix]
MTEIAELANVRRPVVSTWRRRHDTFPQPVAGDQAHPLFDAKEIAAWLIETGRADARRIEGDLQTYTLARLGAQMPPRTLIAALTALICLRHLTDDELLDDGTPALITRLRRRAQEADPEDRLLLAEITELRASWLPRIADELIEAAWNTQNAFERVMEVRDRLGATELSVDRIDPALSALAAALADPAGQADRDGIARIADPTAGPGDLLLAVADSLREDQDVRLTACCPDPYLARLTRRRLTVRSVASDFEVRADASGSLEDANVIVTQQPYRPSEDRTAEQTLGALNDLSLQLTTGATAVVVASADAIGRLDPTSEAAVLRKELLMSGFIKAIVRLPGGLMPYRPGYEVALWVMSADYSSPLRGRILLADVSDRTLTRPVIDALATDVLTWRQEGFDPNARSRVHAIAAPVAALVNTPGPLSPRYLPTEREPHQDIPERVARAMELERVLSDVRPERPALRSDLAVRVHPAPPRTATIAELTRGGRARTNRLSLRNGTRIAAELIRSSNDPNWKSLSYPVLGAPELLERSTPGNRRIDRIAFETTYPKAQRSLPGDLIITTVPQPAVLVDHDGYSAVEFPARILRITERGAEYFTPRVLGALLTRTGRVDGAIRPVQRLDELRLPLLPPGELAHFDRLLAELEKRRRQATDELNAIRELLSIAATGLSDGTLTFAGNRRTTTQ